MATRKPRTLNVEDVFPPIAEQPQSYPAVPSLPDEPEDYDEVTALNNILSELGGKGGDAGYANVYREKPLGSGRFDREYMGKMNASEFVNGGFIEEIKQRYGAGKYEICVYATGHKGVFARERITIASDQLNGVVQHAPSTDGMRAVVEVIRESNQQTMQAILALGQALKPSQQSNLEKLQELKMMRDIMGSPAVATSGASVSEMMGIFKMGVEMARSGNVDPESNDGWVTKVVDKVVSPMMDMLAASPAPTPATRAIPPRPTIPVSQPAQPAQPVAAKEEDMINPLLAFYLKTLNSKAATNAPVEPIADDILARLAPNEADELVMELSKPEWASMVRRHTPAIDTYPDWFQRLRTTIIAYHAEDKQNPVSTSGTGSVLTILQTPAISSPHVDHAPKTGNPEDPDKGVPGEHS